MRAEDRTGPAGARNERLWIELYPSPRQPLFSRAAEGRVYGRRRLWWQLRTANGRKPRPA